MSDSSLVARHWSTYTHQLLPAVRLYIFHSSWRVKLIVYFGFRLGRGSTMPKLATFRELVRCVLPGTTTDGFLPSQLIYQGETAACLPHYKFPNDWLVACTPNHWLNEDKMKEDIKHIIVAFVNCTPKLTHNQLWFCVIVIHLHFVTHSKYC